MLTINVAHIDKSVNRLYIAHATKLSMDEKDKYIIELAKENKQLKTLIEKNNYLKPQIKQLTECIEEL